jgi:hypothetical protein
MSDSVGRVQLDLDANYDSFQKQLNGISGKASGMVTSAFKKLGSVIAGAFAVKALINFGKASIDLASDLAEVQNVVDVVFGESAEQVNNFAKTALNAYGLSELSAKKYASTMGAMLKSMGLSGDAVLGMSQSITALAGDMASFYNLSGDDAFNKIRAGISGETEPLKQLGINMSVANMEAYALSQGITKAYQKMSQSEQALLRYNYLLSVTADAQGDFARTSDGWANQTRILKEQFNSLKATMGSAFIAVLAPVIKMLNWVVSKLQIAANYFKAFVEAVTGVKAETSSASSGMTAIADSAEEAGDATVEAAKKASKALAGFDKLNVLSSSGGDSGSGGSGAGGVANLDIPSLTGLNTSLPEPDTSGVEKVINKVKDMFGSLKSYILTSFAPTIGSWGEAFTNLKEPIANAFQSVKDSIGGLWNETLVPFGAYLLENFVPSIVNAYSETVAPIFSDIMSVAIEEWAKDFEFACNQIDRLVNDIVLPVFELLKNVYIDMCTSLKEEWDKSGGVLIEKFKAFRESLREIWNNIYYNIIKPVWDSIMAGVSDLWENHLKPLWKNVLSFFSSLGEAILTVWNNFLAPLINWVVETFGPYFMKAFNIAWETVKTVAGNIIDSVSGIFTAFKGFLNFITGVFSGNWKKAWEGIKTIFKGIWDTIANIVKAPINIIIGAINAMLNGITSGVNLAIKALNKLSFDVPDWVPGIGGKRWGFNIRELSAPRIPYLAKGGIIDQPTLAMVGERGKEAVVPLENTAFADSIANAIMRVLMPLLSGNKGVGNSSNEGAQVIVLKVGEYELGRITVGAINKYHNVVGKVELEV